MNHSLAPHGSYNEPTFTPHDRVRELEHEVRVLKAAISDQATELRNCHKEILLLKAEVDHKEHEIDRMSVDLSRLTK